MNQQYPFSAIAGQHKLKKALLLCAVNPSIGGVLIKGEKGTAKSTAARGLAAVMPSIQRISGSVFNLSEKEFTSNPEEANAGAYELEEIPVPFVDLPLGASEDRVIGSLDLAAMISEKKKKLLPGLLAGAHRGILYVDEVNLLPDHLVDILLDASASGTNTIQREGLSISHPSRFVLIGTMNPEEGNLRPQFLDRFGLMVEVEAQQDVSERTEVVKRRIAFENNPAHFIKHWNGSQVALQAQITTARQFLSSVVMPEGLLTLISQLCIEWSVASLRADIVLYKTAITIAALANRKTVIAEDIREAAQLVLIHRKGKKPLDRNTENNTQTSHSKTPEEPQPALENGEQQQKIPEKAPSDVNNQNDCEEEDSMSASAEHVFLPAVLSKVPDIGFEKNVFSPELNQGRRNKTTDMPKGFQTGVEKFAEGGKLAVSETIRHAMVRDPHRFEIRNEDLHQNVKSGKTGHLILFVVDASGSMAAGKRMETAKGSILALLENAYQKRDKVGMIAFRGVEAKLLLEPTRSTEFAENALQSLPTGGRTPLAHALQLSLQFIEDQNTENKPRPFLVLLSDGKANVPLAGGGDPWQQVLQLAARIAELNVKCLVLDTESGYLRLGRAAELSEALNAAYLPLDALSTEKITEIIHSKIHDVQQ